MARINIEDSLFRDVRFWNFAETLGNRTLAIGAIVEAFMLAQRFYKSEENKLIPYEEFNRLKFAPFLRREGFIEDREGGVYVKGSDNQFKWLQQRIDAGRISAEARSNKKALESTVVERSLNFPQPPTPTPTLSTRVLVEEERLAKQETRQISHNGSSSATQCGIILIKSNEAEIKELELRLFKSWGTRFSAQAAKIHRHFGGMQNFSLWAIEIEDAYNRKPSEFKIKTTLRRYFSVALSKELELAK